MPVQAAEPPVSVIANLPPVAATAPLTTTLPFLEVVDCPYWSILSTQVPFSWELLPLITVRNEPVRIWTWLPDIAAPAATRDAARTATKTRNFMKRALLRLGCGNSG